jgi:hypothetical protein
LRNTHRQFAPGTACGGPWSRQGDLPPEAENERAGTPRRFSRGSGTKSTPNPPICLKTLLSGRCDSRTIVFAARAVAQVRRGAVSAPFRCMPNRPPQAKAPGWAVVAGDSSSTKWKWWMAISDQVIVLNFGEVIASGSPGAVQRDFPRGRGLSRQGR